MGRVVGEEAGEARVVGLGEEEMERLRLHQGRAQDLLGRWLGGGRH